MDASKKVFIIGPGFIGWNVLELLTDEGYTVSALVRREAHAKQIEDSRGLAIRGTLNDHDLIEKHVAANDVRRLTCFGHWATPAL
jgi:nucleoside-diphosphate-sugar epimerase